jgi:hypothetical protein
LWRLLKGREIKSGASEETAEQAGLVPHPPELGPDQRGELDDLGLDEVGQDRLSTDQTFDSFLDQWKFQ